MEPGTLGQPVGVGDVRIVLERGATADDAAHAIEEGLRDFNARFLGPRPTELRFVFSARDADGAVVGGLVADVWRRWYRVDTLWVADAHRGRGVGRTLMARAEAAAQAYECLGIWLDTADFQARPFYERLGFTVFGELRDSPPGHVTYFMQRRLR
ncbi:MAG: GNAT family N-acetyltransferase [Gemmatimonadaceae bacterium]|jgi:GNAT superfamily N-acetyltransferase|nr:GNAT family N-acetyltransferase [Gemmatimonadaceae bacterium]